MFDMCPIIPPHVWPDVYEHMYMNICIYTYPLTGLLVSLIRELYSLVSFCHILLLEGVLSCPPRFLNFKCFIGCGFVVFKLVSYFVTR